MTVWVNTTPPTTHDGGVGQPAPLPHSNQNLMPRAAESHPRKPVQHTATMTRPSTISGAEVTLMLSACPTTPTSGSCGHIGFRCPVPSLPAYTSGITSKALSTTRLQSNSQRKAAFSILWGSPRHVVGPGPGTRPRHRTTLPRKCASPIWRTLGLCPTRLILGR